MRTMRVLSPRGYRGAGIVLQERKGNVLFNDALNTFYLRLYGVGHMDKGPLG